MSKFETKAIPTPVSATPFFATTRWTVVLNAGDAESPQHSDALLQLCQTYWYPLYAFARRQGAGPEDAQDLTQEFFTRLLANNYLQRADPEKGKFRWFFLGAFKHFLSHERDHALAEKRGGRHVHVSLEVVSAEHRYQLEPSTDLTPEKLYNRAWALMLLGRVKEQLREDYRAGGKGDRFERLEAYLPGSYATTPLTESAQALGMSEGALRVELHRLRSNYRQLLRTEVAHTVATPAEIDDELRNLIAVLQD